MKILCIGQSAWDITLSLKGYPEENKKYKIKEEISCGGGSSNNAAYLLSLWQNDVYLASSIGNDYEGLKIKEELEKVGVKLDYIEEKENIHTTKSYIINNLENGSRTIITNKNPSMKLENINLQDKFDVIYLDGNDYEASYNVLLNNPKALKIIDAGSLKENTKELCSLCDYVVCSNDFARDYTGINFSYNNLDELTKCYKRLEEDFKGQIIITLEHAGSFTKLNNEYQIIPSIKVESVDSTGAGDIYHAAFTHFITHNYSLIDSIKYANIAGALSVTKIGSKDSMPKT